MKLMLGVGFGVLLWMVLFALVAALLPAYVQYYGAQFIPIGAALILSYTFGGVVGPKNIATAASYGLLWVLVAFVFDASITTRLQPDFFSFLSVWATYCAIAGGVMMRVMHF